LALVKKDTTGLSLFSLQSGLMIYSYRILELENEISKLKELSAPSSDDKARLASLEKELAGIMEKKESYVAEHPEQRRLVYRGKKSEGASSSKDADTPKPLPKARNLFDKNGMPRHPERSVYYDPVMNPYGVAPPGMPYLEKRASFER
jgi:hypothetical protein